MEEKFLKAKRTEIFPWRENSIWTKGNFLAWNFLKPMDQGKFPPAKAGPGPGIFFGQEAKGGFIPRLNWGGFNWG